MYLLDILYFAWPLWVSNILLNSLGVYKFWDQRLDFNIQFFDGKELLGRSTTLGGLVVSILFACFAFYFFPEHHLLFIKALSGFCGHILFSFIKRRLDIKPGSYILGISHVDYIILFSLIYLALGNTDYGILISTYIITVIITPFITKLFFRLGLRQHRL